MSNHFILEVSSLTFLALAVSMDAFSVSLSYGLHKLRLKFIVQMGLLIGLFHMALPFSGMMLGQFISFKLGHFPSIISGLLLIVIGLHMLLSAFSSSSESKPHTAMIALFTLAFVVSLDSFSIGISLGMSGVTTVLALLLFGFISMVMTWLGLLLGRKIHRYIGSYSEMLGGAILISFGLHILFI